MLTSRGEASPRGDFVQVSVPVCVAGYDGGRFEKGMQEQANEHPDGQRPVRCMRTVFPMARASGVRMPVVDAPGEKLQDGLQEQPRQHAASYPCGGMRASVRFGQHVEYDNAQHKGPCKSGYGLHHARGQSGATSTIATGSSTARNKTR